MTEYTKETGLVLSRRRFVKISAAVGTSGVVGVSKELRASPAKPPLPEGYGVLIDTTECIGCRKCEWMCGDINRLSTKPLSTFDDKSVFERRRRPEIDGYTVVNRYEDPDASDKPTYVKVQCMHCNEPACVSACLVGALQKDEKTGAVRYDAGKCMGCRYCLVACPFQIPAYEYGNALTPQVRKCTFCLERISDGKGVPGCVAVCPVEALLFGERDKLLEAARRRIEKNPERYVDHIYGERELGGTAWLYLSGRSVTDMGLIAFDERSIPSYTEPLQHAVFKHFIPPLSLFALLGGAMWLFRNRDENALDAERGSR
ncbi:MAG: 4Fe-4S dicluster domain-containing protein [Proteobacteria bacterium]|nr:4Fe-4S dicluster domain-containing protein [Pseudomonadota bacterium]